jgi:hypothetical protein
MSRIKDELLRQQEIQMEYHSQFLDAIYQVLNPEPRLSESDINRMEEEHLASQPLTSITTRSVPTVPSNTTETNVRRSA